jgi:hypothetical protein
VGWDKMAIITDVDVGRAHHLALNSGKNSTDICVNCVQLESQLDDALLQLKSLQKVINLLLQDSEQNEALKKVNFQGILDKSVNVKHVEVGNASMNNSTNYTGNPYDSFISNLSDDRSTASSKTIPPLNAI